MWAHATPNAHMRHARATTQGPRADTAPTLTKYDAHARSPAHARHTLPRGRLSSRVPSAGTHEPLRGARGSDARAAERAGGRNLAARAGLAVRMSSPRPAVKPGPIRGQAGLCTRECTPTAGQPRTQGSTWSALSASCVAPTVLAAGAGCMAPGRCPGLGARCPRAPRPRARRKIDLKPWLSLPTNTCAAQQKTIRFAHAAPSELGSAHQYLCAQHLRRRCS
mmetsp:Transcript_46498/g.129174  ORF Transcript_46498/g.129174 Transcript_46498/m.129174 type:complete len:222 (+) Transcript_46498:102-767(+)